LVNRVKRLTFATPTKKREQVLKNHCFTGFIFFKNSFRKCKRSLANKIKTITFAARYKKWLKEYSLKFFESLETTA